MLDERLTSMPRAHVRQLIAERRRPGTLVTTGLSGVWFVYVADLVQGIVWLLPRGSPRYGVDLVTAALVLVLRSVSALVPRQA
jgi:nucleoside-diphosphate-sugar epimerase